ncbi:MULTISPECIES: hypothetical protein [unclassified Bradyrhizobium]|uniref:hypothetical protein n=1 Tax=unclassified Bradyrhizobium TaxID=2631580 RepID=UPI0029163F51|nr:MULTISPECIES: hypothetical protein [unclassified Bradyrhizobium]
MISFNDAELAALGSGIHRLGIFFRLDVDPVVRLWLGVGKIRPGVNVYDPVGAEYKGLGQIADLPPFKQLTNGAAERITFTLSGVSGDVLKIASSGDAQQVKGARCAYGFALMSEAWALLGPVHWCANFTADYLSIVQAPVDDISASIVRTISLSCGTLLTSRKRPGYSFFSNPDQQGRHPGDRFCERTSVYANNFNMGWPTFPSTT